MITLDEAIQHCKEKAEELRQQAETDYFPIVEDREKEDCLECAREHQQLAEWLTELKTLREEKEMFDSCCKCRDCKHSYKQGWEFPCKECAYAYDNLFTPKENNNDRD